MLLVLEWNKFRDYYYMNLCRNVCKIVKYFEKRYDFKMK